MIKELGHMTKELNHIIKELNYMIKDMMKVSIHMRHPMSDYVIRA